ncbi:MAG: CoA transferase [Theionarchaea archaeon]|nr:MAG: formyl-CoA transferase [Theionarchaea archaeon DG-70]MBU7012463.1 CoA transferase [Theionarchaea archaeon]
MKPLDTITVLDLSRALAGPYCTLMLADMGARVIKVERPGTGDDTRGWGPPFIDGQSAYFLSINRNKKSVTLNLKEKEGKEIFYTLSENADVIVENFRPGTTEKLGISYGDIKNINEKIIYCSISGFGQTGPYKTRPGYDLILQGMGGLMTMTGEEKRPPVKIGVAITDIAAGMFAAYGIVLALYTRERTGTGQYIDTSMLDCQVSWLTYQAGNFFATGKSPKRLGSAHPTIVPYQAFKTTSGYINVAVGSEKLWQNFCQAINHQELADNPHYKTNRDRVEHRKELIIRLQEIFSEKTTEEWLKVLQERGVPAGPIYTFDQIFSDSQVLHRSMLVEMEHPTAGIIKQTGVPVKLSETPGSIELHPPLLGEHTAEILTDLGYTDDEIRTLKEKGVI